ncbi:hypothetical protein ACFSJI_08560 [Streptomyces calvus]|uniref:hypothetical protein n=1 Tax=Streptomyces TaxID=1883 RepID=UPI00136CD983|nr:hypothetical protein [Streptomyces sp. SID7804]
MAAWVEVRARWGGVVVQAALYETLVVGVPGGFRADAEDPAEGLPGDAAAGYQHDAGGDHLHTPPDFDGVLEDVGC